MNDPLNSLDKMLEASATEPPGADPAQRFDMLPPYVSPTLQRIGARRRPEPSTHCEVCPASLWFATPSEVRCFCRVMHSFTWTAEEPTAIVDCDGEVEANLERLAQFEEP